MTNLKGKTSTHELRHTFNEEKKEVIGCRGRAQRTAAPSGQDAAAGVVEKDLPKTPRRRAGVSMGT